MFSATVATLALLMSQSAPSQTHPVESVLRQFIQATLDYDVAKLETLIDPEFIEISPIGEVDPHDVFLGYYKVPVEQRGPKPRSFSLEELIVRNPSPDTCVAIYRQKLVLGTEEKPMEMAIRVTSVLKKSKDTWRLYSNQYTGIRAKRAG